MARIRIAAALVALAFPLLLSGCAPTRLHILISDFHSKGVDGLRLYRVAKGGVLEDAGYIAFGRFILTSEGLQLQYTQFTAQDTVWGPLVVPVEIPAPGQVALEMVFANPGSPGYFRFASYNEHGTSRPTKEKIYAVSGQQPS